MTARLISSISVEKLFGLYTYDIPSVGELSDAAILYGDNGVGKSTLLRLVFHLLSAADNRGHRTALYKTDFALLKVSLASGVTLTARFVDEPPSKLLVLEVSNRETKLAAWDYRPRDDARFLETEDIYIEINERGRQIVRRRPTTPRKHETGNIPRGEQAYLAALTSNVPTLFILNADRRLDSDTVADPSDEVELRRVMQYGEPKRINELVVSTVTDLDGVACWCGHAS